MSLTIIEQLEQWVLQILQDTPDLFLVSIKTKPTNNFKVFIDGDNGFSLEACIKVNRQLYKLIEEAQFFPDGDFSLEISSPGVTEPLKLQRQYSKNIGREVEITFNDATQKIGKLIEATPEDIIIEHTEGKGKKAITQQIVIPITNIKAAIVQIKF